MKKGVVDEYLVMVNDCEQRESRLTEWEREFIQSIKEQLESGKFVTARQLEILDDVWEKATARG